MFAFISRVQLALDALDRLVDTLEERGSLSAVEAARSLFATSSISEGLACSLLAELTAGDSRVVCAGATVSLAGRRADPLLEEAEFVVFDLETTGLSAAHCRICEVGAVRVRALKTVDSFESLVNPGVALPEPVARLTGLREEELRRAPSVSSVLRRFLTFAGDDLLVAHNARFDQRFLERQLLHVHGRRLSEPPLCTAALARRLLEGRARRVGLARLAHFFGVPTRPCHRALPDAEATAQILVHLIGLAQELGARRLSDLRTLAAPRKRRVYAKRSLARGAPTRPGVYLFHDCHGQVLYVGRARDLRGRLRSYFRSERQRPSVEAALLALDRIEWRVLGSELEAALEELRLIRSLQPPANSRSRRKEHGLYLRRRGEDFVVTKTPTPLGPIAGRRTASLAARALASSTTDELDGLLEGGPLPRLRARLSHLAESLRYEEAARLRDRIEALEHVVERLRRLERLRRVELCLIAPAATPGGRKAFFVCGGVVCAVRTLPPGVEASTEIDAALAVYRSARDPARETLTPEQAEDLLLVDGFVRRPPPELVVLPLRTWGLKGASKPRCKVAAFRRGGPKLAERMIEANGVELCTESFGDPSDPPILLVMGIGGSMLWWEDGFCRMLAENRRFVIRYDHRDTGRSVTYEPGHPEYTGADLVADAAGVLDAYGITAAHVVGVSAGGAFAQLLALDFADRVLSLVLISTSRALPGERGLPPPTEEFTRFVTTAEADWSDPESVIEYLVDYSRVLAGGRRPFDETAARDLARRDVERARNFAAAQNHDAIPDDGRSRGPLSSITAPTLVIHGAADPMFPLEHGEALADEIPDARVLTLQEAGHGVDRADWETIVRAILEHTEEQAK